MKVALVIEKFHTAGGAERQCMNLARSLLARGHEVHVFARGIAPLEGIRPHKVPPEGLTAGQSFSRQTHALLLKETFDIVHSFARTLSQDVLRLGGGIHKEYLARTDPAYSLLGRLWRRVRPKERWELNVEDESLRESASKVIVAVSKRVKEEAIRHYRVRPEKIEVIYNGVDAAEFKPSPEARARVRSQLGLGAQEYVLLFCGTGFRRKGLDFAIAAVDRVSSARLVVAGVGPARSHPRVLMLGRRTDAADLYAAADALILPALYDPFPNVCLEAMASAIPVIVSRAAGPSEIVDGDSIVVEDPADLDALAGAVKRLEDPAARLPMGEAARRKALQFTPERVLEENLHLYERIVREKRR